MLQPLDLHTVFHLTMSLKTWHTLAYASLDFPIVPPYWIFLYPQLSLDANHSLYSVPNLAWEKAVQACAMQSFKYPGNVCQGAARFCVKLQRLNTASYHFNLEASGLVFIPLQLRPTSPTPIHLTHNLQEAIAETLGAVSPTLTLVAAFGNLQEVICVHAPTPNDSLLKNLGSPFLLDGQQFLLELASPIQETNPTGISIAQEESVAEHR